MASPSIPISSSTSHHQQISCAEEAYAGPAAQTPDAKRPRRIKGSYEDTGLRISPDLLNGEYRVGGPFLCRVPTSFVKSLPSDHPIAQIWDTTLGPLIIKIVQDFQIECQWLGVTKRTSYGDTEDGEDTIYVGAVQLEGEIDNRWIAACMKIRELAGSYGFPALNVEIADRRGLGPRLSFPVEPSHPLIPRWPAILQQIRQDLSDFDWIAVEVFRRGRQRTDEDYDLWQSKPLTADDRPVTVVITIKEDSEANWANTREYIVKFLDSNNFGEIAVEIGRGVVWNALEPPRELFVPRRNLLEESSYEIQAKPGQSIGPHQSNHRPGTLGGFVSIQHPVDHTWQKLGVTCFHCVAAPEMGLPMYEKWMKEGIAPNDPANKLEMDQPSLSDHREAMEWISAEINKIKTPAYFTMEKRLNDPAGDNFVLPDEAKFHHFTKTRIQEYGQRKVSAESFFSANQQYLGKVFAASGLRQGPSCSLDWALVDVNQLRLSENHLPSKQNVLMELGPRSNGANRYHPTETTMTRTAVAELNKNVYKEGRATAITCGIIDSVKNSLLKSWTKSADGTSNIEIESLDPSILAEEGSRYTYLFADKGDAGSWVFSTRGEFIGMIWGGNSFSGASYYTPAKELFDDISQMTGAVSVALS